MLILPAGVSRRSMLATIGKKKCFFKDCTDAFRVRREGLIRGGGVIHFLGVSFGGGGCLVFLQE